MKLDSKASCYLLSEDELKLLLAGSKASKYFGLMSAEAAYFGENRSFVAKTLLSLMQKESIVSNGNSFSLYEPLKSLLLCIKNAQRVILIAFDGNFPLCCYDDLTSIVTMQRLDYQPYTVRLAKSSRTQICKTIMDFSANDDLSEESIWNSDAKSSFKAEIFSDGQLTRRLFVSDDGVKKTLNLLIPGEEKEEYELNESILEKLIFD